MLKPRWDCGLLLLVAGTENARTPDNNTCDGSLEET